MFWKSDRWGRSAAHVLTTVGELRGRDVTVKSLTENFDLDTKEGRFKFAVLAAAAEYELELRAERQAEGIAADRRRQAAGTMLPGMQRFGLSPPCAARNVEGPVTRIWVWPCWPVADSLHGSCRVRRRSGA